MLPGADPQLFTGGSRRGGESEREGFALRRHSWKVSGARAVPARPQEFGKRALKMESTLCYLFQVVLRRI